MLVLTRKFGEKICIGDNIIVTVLKTDRGKTRIGIEAPPDVPVYRQEIWDRMQQFSAPPQLPDGMPDDSEEIRQSE